LSKLEGNVTELTSFTCQNPIVFNLICVLLYNSIQTNMLSLYILVIIVYNLFDRTLIHACHTFKCHLLALEDDKDVFYFILKDVNIQSTLAIANDINYENSYDSPILNHEHQSILWVSFACFFFKFFAWSALWFFLEAYYICILFLKFYGVSYHY